VGDNITASLLAHINNLCGNADTVYFYLYGMVSANGISWFEAAQFVNYLNTSTGHQAAYKFTADIMGVWVDGDDGYDASNPFRNSNAKHFLPTEDEWVKAAYWNGTGLSEMDVVFILVFRCEILRDFFYRSNQVYPVWFFNKSPAANTQTFVADLMVVYA